MSKFLRVGRRCRPDTGETIWVRIDTIRNITLPWRSDVRFNRAAADYPTPYRIVFDGMPITQQRRIGKAELDLLRKRIEIAPTPAEFKHILKSAVHDGRLEYVHGDRRRRAGFYPSGRADELARTAKNKAKEGDKTGGKTGFRQGVKPE